MAKHGGCYICGGGQDEILISVPLMYKGMSIALCKTCHAKPGDQIKAEVEAKK